MTTTQTVSPELLAEWAKRGDDAGRLARELLTIRFNVHHEVHRCFICDEPFKAGQLVPPSEDGLGHRACFGEDRDGYVQDIGSMEPLGPNDPIPAGDPYVPAEYFPLRNAQSEAVAVKALLHHVHKMLGYHIVSPPTPDHQFVNVCNGDLRVLAELFEAAALTHPAPPLAEQAGLSRDELAEIISNAGAPPGPPSGPIRALPESHFLRVQAYKQADAVLAALTAALEAKQ